MLQELVQGRNLQQMMDAGWRPAEQHVERIASEVLELLVYLQQQQVTSCNFVNFVESVRLHFHRLQIFYVHVLQKLASLTHQFCATCLGQHVCPTILLHVKPYIYYALWKLE